MSLAIANVDISSFSLDFRKPKTSLLIVLKH